MSGTLRGVLDAARMGHNAPEEDLGTLTPTQPPRTPPRATGKSSNPDFERLTVYVRKKTKDEVSRTLIGTGTDLSDLVQALLEAHLST